MLLTLCQNVREPMDKFAHTIANLSVGAPECKGTASFQIKLFKFLKIFKNLHIAFTYIFSFHFYT